MTGTEQQTFFTELNGGRTINETLFFQLLNLAKDRREMMRPWVILREEDTSITISGSDSFNDAKALPTDFLRTYARQSVVLISNDENIIEPLPIQFNKRLQHRNRNNFYTLDIKNNTITFTGTRDRTYTVHLYFIAKSDDIVAESSWSFPEYAHALLPYDVAVAQKGGIDFDDINARMTRLNGQSADEIFRSLVMWDDVLQRQELNV